MNKLVACFAHINNYYIPIKFFFQKTLGFTIITTPPITKKTLELGNKISPDFVCVPFKYNMGNFIEAINKGANTIIQIGGSCRFGYFSELQEKILKDNGFNIKFINVFKKKQGEKKNMITATYKQFKKMNKKLNFIKFCYYGLISIFMIFSMDSIDKIIRKKRCYEIKKNSFNKIKKEFLDSLKRKKRITTVIYNYIKYLIKFNTIPINKNKNKIKIGIVGDLFTLMEHNANMNIEQELSDLGVSIKRFVNVTYLIILNKQKDEKILRKNKYIKFPLGAGGTDSIIKSLYFIKKKYDGILHLKSFGCTPEINAIPILQNISKDYNIPIMSLSFDVENSELGLKTRLEAFVDMIKMKKEGLNE